MIGKTIRLILSILLTLIIVGFVITYSLASSFEKYRELKADEDDEGKGGIVEEVIEEIIEENEEIDFDQLYNQIIERCNEAIEENVSLSDNQNFEGFVFNCEIIRAGGIDAVKETLAEKTAEFVEDKIIEGVSDKIPVNEFQKQAISVSRILWFFGIVSAVIIFCIAILGRSASFVNLGIVGIIAGLPFLASKAITFAAKSRIASAIGSLNADAYNSLLPLLDLISKSLFANFLFVFSAGCVLLGIGIGIRLGLAGKEKTKSGGKDLKSKTKKDKKGSSFGLK